MLYFFLKSGGGGTPLHYMALKIPGKVGGTPSCHTWGGQAVSGVGQQGQARVRPGGSEVRQRSAQPGGQAFSKRGGPGFPAGGHEVRGTRGQGGQAQSGSVAATRQF
jgi:hypothetical protein